jgi:uncharacterized protein
MPVEKRFVADSMLGKLAKWLRVLGFDTLYANLQHQEQLDAYRDQGYLLLTRHRRWCGQPGVLCLAANDPVEQLREVVAAVPIERPDLRRLKRCLRCNTLLEQAERRLVVGHVPDYVLVTSKMFYRCPECRRFYWPGSHPQRMAQWIHSALGWSLELERTGGAQ